jgi:predicted amidohydrolase
MITPAKNPAILPYAACSVQSWVENYNPNIRGEFERETLMKRNLQRMCDYIDAIFTVGVNNPTVRLVCFPEFSIGGLYNNQTTVQEVKRYQAITIPGPETDALAEKAKKYNTYIAACNHENDPAWPDNFFNTAFIINPEGKVILKYRKMNIAFGLNPHDIFDRYINPITKTRDFFPVVDTRIGRLACFICGDLMIPEIVKASALKGAEVVLHLNSGFAGELPRHVLRTRAWDNTVYIVEDNWSSRIISTEVLGGTKIPTAVDSRGGGQSMIVDYFGNIIAEAGDKTPQLVYGMINIMALRETRKGFRMGTAGGDAMTRTRTEVYAPFYNRTLFPPNQVFVEGPIQKINDASVTKRRDQAVKNREKFLEFYSEDDVK